MAEAVLTRTASARPNWRRRRSIGTSVATYAIALILAAIVLVPLIYVVLGGFRTTGQIAAQPVAMPHPWVWSNYTSVLTSHAFWRQVLNSAVIAGISTVIIVFLGACAAYALSRYTFRGREAIYVLFTVGLLVPISVAILPLYIMLRQLNLLDSWLGVALPQAAFGLPITIIILRPFMRAVPAELEDAAAVDGCSRIGFFFRVLVPLSRPALMTVATLALVTSWNAFLLPFLILNNTNEWTVPLGVANFQTAYTQDTAKILAYTALSMVPALLFFVFAERRIVGGLSGAVKG